jgi:hypothetical protein
MEHENENNTDTPPNALIKITSFKKLKFLSMEERGILITNVYHYHLGDDLLEMTPLTEMFFTDLAEVFEFNKLKYKATVERNRENGKKNLGKNKKEPKTQNNPLGYIDNPEETKDKNIFKPKPKTKNIFKPKPITKNISKEETIIKEDVKDFEKEKVIERENELDINQQNPVDIQINRSLFDINTKSYNSIEKIKAIVKLDINPIFDYESSRFIKNCKTLVKSSGWEGFYEIILNSEAKELPALFDLYKPELSKETILDLRTNLFFYLGKFNKILN